MHGASPPFRFSWSGFAAGGFAESATVTVCTGATNGAVTATTSTGTSASADLSAITVPAPGGLRRRLRRHGYLRVDLRSQRAPSATHRTLAYAGSPERCRPTRSARPAPHRATRSLGADSAASMWMNARRRRGRLRAAGRRVTLTVEGGHPRGRHGFRSSRRLGTPATGTFTTDSTGRGFVSLSLQSGNVSVVDLSLSVPAVGRIRSRFHDSVLAGRAV